MNSNAGIQELMAAEQKASQIVAEARLGERERERERERYKLSFRGVCGRGGGTFLTPWKKCYFNY
jgi:hypothetical protein